MEDDPREIEYYPIVEKWMKKRFHCFKVVINRGLKYGRIDVLGFRDVGGDLSGEIETIAVEVKRGTTAFALSSGQTLGYRVYANRVYLADIRPKSFLREETQIANTLGIGLIQIIGKTCKEELSSPYYRPITKLNLELLETIGLGNCQFCGSVFEIGDLSSSKNRWSKLTRENISRAVENEKGLIFWNMEVSGRKNRFHPKRADKDASYERRFICPDCIRIFFSSVIESKE